MESPLALLCQQVLRRHALTSHGGAWGSRGSPRRWTSSRTRCTCCRPGRAGESDPGHTRIRARSSTNRTIRSASRRPGARESGLNRTRIRARSSSNRNVCILSPCQFSFPLHSIPHPNCRRRHKCDVSRGGAGAFGDWRRTGRGFRIAASLLVLTSPMASPLAPFNGERPAVSPCEEP